MEYLSQECYDRLTQELNELVSVELPKARNELEEARAKGDLSENFEYHAAKRAHGRLLSRVEITNLATNTTMAYTIVNPHEANVKEGKISIKSPIAEALLGRKVGDVVTAHVPCGVLRLRIEKITV